jgi:uncharacterized membrane protein YjjP (DUF1212 family)
MNKIADPGFDRTTRGPRAAWEYLRDQAAARRLSRLLEPPEPEEPGDPETYRAMDLALRVGELLLASGETTENVSEAMQSLSVAFGLHSSEAAVTFTAISISFLPGKGLAPVTGERVVRRRTLDYAKLAAVHALVEDAALGAVDLDEATERLRFIKRDKPPYPRWLLAISLALVSASASVLSGGGWLVTLLAFVGTLLADRAAAWLGRRGVAEFYQFAVAALIGSLIAILLVWMKAPVAAPTVIIGAIMALLPGRPLVAAVMDGISGSFVSSTARMMEAFFIVAALISGVGIAVYAAMRLGVPLSVDGLAQSVPKLTAGTMIGAVAIAVTFAISLVVPWRALPTAAIGGALIWVLYVLLRNHDFSPVMASAVAAAVVGTGGHLMARRHRSPALPYIVPIMGPLLPGSLMYRALLELSQGNINGGALTLFQSISVALALAAGLSLGGEIVRAIGRGRRVGAGPHNRPAARRTRGY